MIMLQFDKILCPFDLSEHSEEAIKYAIKLSDSHTEIVLLNVIQLPCIIDPNGFTYYDLKVDDLRKDFEEAMQKRVAELKAKYKIDNIGYKIEVGINPAELILKVQKEDNFDMIVIGSHGRKGLSRILMGSVAEAVLRDAACPVLIIRKDMN